MDTFVENSIRPPGYRWETRNDQMTALESIREHFNKEPISMVYRSWDQRLFFTAGNCTHRFGCAYKYEAKFRPSPPTLLKAEIGIKEIDWEVLQKLEKGWAIFAVDEIIQNRIWEVLEKHKVPLGYSGAVFHNHVGGAAPLVIQKDPSNPWGGLHHCDPLWNKSRANVSMCLQEFEPSLKNSNPLIAFCAESMGFLHYAMTMLGEPL